MRIVNEASNRVQQLSRGEVGLTLEIRPKDGASMEGTEGVKIDSRASNKILFFAMNNKIKPFDDPKVRQPNIDKARKLLGWEPQMPLEDGLRRTIDYFAALVEKGIV